jgi:hypothetical protein
MKRMANVYVMSSDIANTVVDGHSASRLFISKFQKFYPCHVSWIMEHTNL